MPKESNKPKFFVDDSFVEWVIAKRDTVFGFQVYKRMFTPYEQQNAFVDESEFTDVHFNSCKIREAVPLGNGDWWLGLQIIDESADDDADAIEYYRLSEIRLWFWPWMQGETDNESGI